MKRNRIPFLPIQHAPAHAMNDCFILLWSRLPLDYQWKQWRGIGLRGKESFHVPPTITLASIPTQHEKLEAALLWRDFGREIGESARVEAALSQLLTTESSE